MTTEEKSRKRQRGSNFTAAEKEILVSVVEKFKTIIENKKTDNTTNNDKEIAWNKITKIFNAQNSTYRATETLKTFYKNLKKNVKKKTADYKKEIYLTGGGPAPPDLTPTEEKLLTVVNRKTIFGLNNPSDSDIDTIDLPSTSLNLNSDVNTNLEMDLSLGDEAQLSKAGKINWKIYKMQDLQRPLSSCLLLKEKSFTNKNNIEIIHDIGNVQPETDDQADDEITPLGDGSNENGEETHEKKEKGKTKKLDRRRPLRRPQSTVRALTSSELGEKYNILADKKLLLVEKLTEEHNLRIEALKLEIEYKKKLLNNNN